MIELPSANSDYAPRRIRSSVVGQRARDGEPLRHETGERLLHPTRLVVLRPPLGVPYTAYLRMTPTQRLFLAACPPCFASPFSTYITPSSPATFSRTLSVAVEVDPFCSSARRICYVKGRRDTYALSAISCGRRRSCRPPEARSGSYICITASKIGITSIWCVSASSMAVQGSGGARVGCTAPGARPSLPPQRTLYCLCGRRSRASPLAKRARVL